VHAASGISALGDMELTASSVDGLVDAEIAGLSDAPLLELIAHGRIGPRKELRPWAYQDGLELECWVVLENSNRRVGLAYCDQGFGPRAPWGLLWLHGDGCPSLSMGDESGWFSSFEEAARDCLS
jgi:hypothetical protein